VKHLAITSHLCNNKHYIHHHRLTGASSKKNNAKKLTKKIASAYPVLILTSRYWKEMVYERKMDRSQTIQRREAVLAFHGVAKTCSSSRPVAGTV
jgi:hypothetical protein